MSWPPITEPLLLERLGMDDERFAAFLLDEVLPSVGVREYTRAAYERGAGYPWERPEGSFLLRDGDVLPPTPPATAVERYPLLATGSNGAPAVLRRKFAHLPDPEDRTCLVLAGHLHDHDVGVAAHPTAYGSMPATPFASAGTAVRVAVLHVTAAQLTQLAWTELTYRLGRLDDVRLVADDDTTLDSVYLWISRLGTFCPHGEPVALAAVPARDRSAPALSQPQLLDLAARLALGDTATGEDLVRAVFEDAAAFANGPGAVLRSRAAHLRASNVHYFAV